MRILAQSCKPGSRREWLESVKDKTPQEVLDNLSLLIKLGVDKTTYIGKVRALHCTDCGDAVEGSLKASWVCDDCEEFVCTDCRSMHLTKHISTTLQKGLQLHKGHLEAVKRKELSTEAERRIPDPEPEIDEADPMSAFFASRDKKPKLTGPSTAQVPEDRCESSDEGEFAAVDWCSICGSETCQLTVRECSSSKKLEKTVLALQVMCNDATLCDWETKVGAEKLQAEDLERVAGRRILKASTRAAIDKRRNEGGWKRLNELASKDKCIGSLTVSRRRDPTSDYVRRARAGQQTQSCEESRCLRLRVYERWCCRFGTAHGLTELVATCDRVDERVPPSFLSEDEEAR